MTVGSDFRASLPNMGTSHADFALGLDSDRLEGHPRMFKKHKVLPHPRKDELQRSGSWRYGQGSEASLSQNGASPTLSPSLRLRASRSGRGPEPPPTPPAHSRTSSASHPADPSTPKLAGDSLSSADDAESRPPATPTNQQTLPTPNLTPDRTPPGPATSQTQQRPPITGRNSSKVTTGSRAESFTTARENPSSSDDDDGKSTMRPGLASARTSQSTVRQVSRETRSVSQPVGLGLSLDPDSIADSTPRIMPEFNKFDGEWASGERGPNEAVREWDSDLMRNVTIRKRRPSRPRETRKTEVVDDRAVTPTNATRAIRSMSLEESPIVYPSRRVASDRYPTRAAPVDSESSASIDIKRSSILSTKSNASTVVEARLVETAPQRRKTLRHVRKQSALRDSGSEVSPASSAPTSVSPAADGRRQRQESAVPRAAEAVRESYASTATNNSISSRKARRSVWNNGGVPVVVIPERRSSVKSNNSKSPSLRSTSSRRSRSLSSVPTSQPSKSRENVPVFERPYRRSRALSESDGSRAGDERTMDFPPVIPTRSSSLSAPTSRNVSRTGSLTAESLKTHNVFQAQQAHHALQNASRELDKLQNQPPPTSSDTLRNGRGTDLPSATGKSESREPTVPVGRTPREKQSRSGGSSVQTLRDSHGTQRESGADRDEDPFYGTRLSVQNTPLSVASADTAPTSQAEVSEAMAVNIYPHQSKSVVLVDHSAKPSESSSLEQYKGPGLDIPVVKMTDVNGGVPVTPPQQFSVDDVDSPLRNPRAPPQPPAINFIPATPSGLTPTTEKQTQLGNYYEMTAEKPKRSLSLLKRALTRRTTSDYGPSPARPVGLLTRTFSLSRNIRRRDERPRLKRRSTGDSGPQDETRLHPHWRPAYAEDERCDCGCCSSSDEDDYDDDHDDDHDDEDDRTYRYPPIDNRPAPFSPSFPAPRRRLSERLKRTFAILPRRDDRDNWDNGYGNRGGDGGYYDTAYPATADDAPDRRTIRRTPSGNLRVMKFRRSMESLTRGTPPLVATATTANGRPYYPPASQRRYTRLWRSLSLKARTSLRRGSSQRRDAENSGDDGTGGTTGFLPTLGDRINFPRRLSERRREKRTQELRGKISGPREVRDGVGEVIRRNSWRDRDALYVEAQQRERRLLRERGG
ncbi:hypothetical protein CHGG_00627 [Chaetomium globosum CBS 148.51]|uniref:Uncharacterized protein n=1 Tax=Chaetomium globosum (strain ATCC 6205 / CBS 148.51 / DSM 1962 / NBRC 6347 / NRRL 1970) TaxID=306901 RepID=Q2HGM7_CHAGB|nr:uncharacterized protein CHGG_00627 [Chaetomium globosum CBS 148.51]EAQ92392.1 hypothetical protein CHGG_00627 [Chaetomium globosum CBS 148.51]